MSTRISYEPSVIRKAKAIQDRQLKRIQMKAKASQEYILRCVNESNSNWVFYVYQTLPSQTPEMFSLAWFASPYLIAPGNFIEFVWFTTYEFVWGNTGVVRPGVTFRAGGIKEADLVEKNRTSFGIVNSAPDLTIPEKDPSNAGSLVIQDMANIPADTYSVGIGMSGYGTFLVQAEPNLTHIITPTPQYWIAAGQEVQVGDILNIQTVTNSGEVIFPPNIFAQEAKLNRLNEWEITPI